LCGGVEDAEEEEGESGKGCLIWLQGQSEEGALEESAEGKPGRKGELVCEDGEADGGVLVVVGGRAGGAESWEDGTGWT